MPRMTQVVTGAWIPSDQTFGARLALIRQRMGWGNVAEAARACGIPVETWRGWEMKKDTSLPHNVVQRAQAIADQTGVDFYWLLTGQAASTEGSRKVSTRGFAGRLTHRNRVRSSRRLVACTAA